MADSRELILQNIKTSLNGKTSTEFKPYSGFDNGDYISDVESGDLITEFREKLEALSGNVEIIGNKKSLNKTVSDIFNKTNSKIFTGWNHEDLTDIYKVLKESGMRYTKSTRKDLQAKCDIGITLADYAISESGTIVLYNNKIQNRNSSLIVPIHIAILKKENILKSIFDLVSRISHDYRGLENIRELSNCITLITGPSRTADIELNLTLGVHGPKELYVIVM